MKYFIKLNLFLLCISLLGTCSSPDHIEPTEDVLETETHGINDTPVLKNLTEESLEEILNQFKIMDIIKSDENINPALNYSSKSLANRVSEDEDCNHEITNIFENKAFNFNLDRDYSINPLTEAEIEQIINAPVVSTTESSIKYFLSDKTPSTDCETEEMNAPIPNHDDLDDLFRPTFYSYDHAFDYLGEHHYVNEFYIERSEVTTPIESSIASSNFITNGILEKRVDRLHQVHYYSKETQSHIENLKLSGFMSSQQGYKFHFIDGSSQYFKYSVSIKEFVVGGSPFIEDTVIDIVNRYVVQFDINCMDNEGRVEGVFKIPFLFDITIDYEEIIETLKENENEIPYTKTVPLYVGYINRNVGDLKFTLDEEGEKWNVKLPEKALILSDSELDYILDNNN